VDGSLSVIAKDFDRLGEKFAFVFPSRCNLPGAQVGQDFVFGFLAHKVVHKSDNTDFWRNDPFTQTGLPSACNKTFGANRSCKLA
jgi:hypothetical protein